MKASGLGAAPLIWEVEAALIRIVWVDLGHYVQRFRFVRLYASTASKVFQDTDMLLSVQEIATEPTAVGLDLVGIRKEAADNDVDNHELCSIFTVPMALGISPQHSPESLSLQMRSRGLNVVDRNDVVAAKPEW